MTLNIDTGQGVACTGYILIVLLWAAPRSLSTTLGDDKNQLLHESNAHLVFVNCHLQCWCNQYTVIYLMQMPSLFSRVFTASATDEDGDEGDDEEEADDERNGWV